MDLLTCISYYNHKGYAGISAFASRPAEEAQRNAHFVAVGVLVPLDYGRLGRSWLYAEKLENLAEQLVHNAEQTGPLEAFWNAHCLDQQEPSQNETSSLAGPPGVQTEDSQPGPSLQREGRDRALSDIPALETGSALSPTHPALSLTVLLDTFGPLAFPLYRAALLRKRILFVGSAPVRRSCDFVLSNIPAASAEAIHGSPEHFEQLARIDPLFSVGVHDIPLLKELATQQSLPSQPGSEATNNRGRRGWLACTTDDIIATKTSLYDVVVNLPDRLAGQATKRLWPQIRTSSGMQIKATQRDLRRYRTLQTALHHLRQPQAPADPATPNDTSESPETEDTDSSPLLRTPTAGPEASDEPAPLEDENSLTEPASWLSAAYTSFMWWASAGEKDAFLAEEVALDEALLADLPLLEEAARTHDRPRPRPAGNSSGGPTASDRRGSLAENEDSDAAQQIALVLIAYFHRLTALMFETAKDAVDSAGEGAAAAGREVVPIDGEDVRGMGLDVWSEADKGFVKEFVGLYFGSEARVTGASVECCGLRIC
ncbi:hypothetical protein LTR50_006202 [Elasticomyces elasticus]|nr:hypothetical protein LTR50_006202 [Elasticomyces elasticus]